MNRSIEALSGTVLITGGAGFIGSAVVRCLLADTELNIVNVDKLTYASNLASLPRQNSRHRLEVADICDGAPVRRIFNQYQPLAVIHLAAESHVDRSIDGPGEFVRTNLIGTYTLLQEALLYFRGLSAERVLNFRFLHISTDEVFGSLGKDGSFSEASPYAPNSPYSATKAGSDHLVRAWHETYGLPAIVTNCSNNYGPAQFPEKLIPMMILRGREGKSLPVYGDGMHVRDWLYVEDHARALLRVLACGQVGETYNIGSRNERTNKEIVGLICDLLDEFSPDPAGSRQRLIEHVADRPGHDRRYAIDPGKIERQLDWRPRETFDSGLAATVRWYLDNSAWLQAIRQRGYEPNRAGIAPSQAAVAAPVSAVGAR